MNLKSFIYESNLTKGCGAVQACLTQLGLSAYGLLIYNALFFFLLVTVLCEDYRLQNPSDVCISLCF